MRTLHNTLVLPDAVRPYVDADLVDEQHVRAVSLLAAMSGLDMATVPTIAHVAFALVLDAPQSGHTCVDFASIGLWANAVSDTPDDRVTWPGDASEWIDAVRECSVLVAPPDERDVLPRKPFILDGNLLYASRSFDEELRVAQYLSTHAGTSVRIITGGPGSGKTTQVAHILVHKIAEHARNNPGADPLKIALAAPTGLAAKRMSKAISAAVRSDEVRKTVVLDEQLLAIIDSVPKRTVHRLLGFNPTADVQYRHNAERPLQFDVVIVDEVSMLPLSMMARLLEAMQEGAELILVGDANQLASVEAGTVLADIVTGLASRGESAVRHLTTSWRFTADSPVGALSTAINAGDVDAVHAVLATTFPSGESDPKFTHIDSVGQPDRVNEVARVVVEHARTLCELASQPTTDADRRRLLEFRDSLQVVTAHRGGLFGVSGWNASVERRLGALASGSWYFGRPVMVTKNDPINDLSNGDIGVVCLDEGGNRVVAFGDQNEVRTIPVAKIPHVETVHALTIHKSQGSEYAHTIVVLPQKASRIVTRELLYTGITRAKPDLTLIAPLDVIDHAVRTRIQRATGLSGRL